ncbi:MAG: topology modulation protein [Actinomycetota bacterium]|nr:topology modulation protein [Actinomycetota bacterium]
MDRIAVIGCGGSGKTTLSRRLGELLDLPVIHIDAHYWREIGGQRLESTPEQWARCHSELVSRDRWIIDGMKAGVLPERLAAAGTVIFLDVSTRACLMGILRRRVRFRGQLRPDVGVYDRISWEFIRWVSSFRRRQRPRILGLLEGRDGEVIVLRSRRDVRRMIAAINQPIRFPDSTCGLEACPPPHSRER